MLIETHSHTSQYSKCSIISPVDLVRRSAEKGLQGLIITEHHYLWSEEQLAQLRAEARVERHFLILSGQEVDTDLGHVLVYGGDRTVPGRTPLKELRAMFPAAALVWAHPFRHGKHPAKEQLCNPLLDGIEVLSLNQTTRENCLGLHDWHTYRFTALSGCDAHSEAMIGVYPTHFDHPVSTISDIASEIKHGRCRPFSREIPREGGDLLATEIVLGTRSDSGLHNDIIEKAATDKWRWNSIKESARVMETLYRSDFKKSPYRVPKLIGIDEQNRVMLEENQRGKNLFEIVTTINSDIGTCYFGMAARWLAKLHNLQLRLRSPEDTVQRERAKFEDYRNSFRNSPQHLNDALRIIDHVQAREEEFFQRSSNAFVQVHGDYHPKNIIIGQDRMFDPGTLFVSVIDFNSSFLFCPAFDIGYFLSHFQSQCSDFPGITNEYNEKLFLDAYREEYRGDSTDIEKQVKLFKLRSNLSIASYFIKLGLGESKKLTDLMTQSMSLLEQYV